MRFNIGLLETVSVLLSLYVFVGHLIAVKALLLPVELKVDVASNGSHRQISVSQFHYFAQDVFVTNSRQCRVHLEVRCNHFIGELCKCFNLVGWERIFLLLFRLRNSLGNLTIIEGSFLFRFLSLFLGGLPRGSDLRS